MLELSRFYGIIIKMYYNQTEHNPPHIHAIYGDFQQLKNKELFKKVRVDAGGYGISWNENIDLRCNELWYNGTEKI